MQTSAQSAQVEQKKPHERVYALVGNPNSGKTTLFNQLTGLNQKVANYPGVTVEKKVGTCYSQHGEKMTVIDLPGSYSLSAQSPDEAIMQKVLMGRIDGMAAPERILCVVDASNLERTLYLAAQATELGLPVILALNMMDIAEKRGIFIDTGRLEKALGLTVVPIQANKKSTLIPLKLAMSRTQMPLPKGISGYESRVMESVLAIQAHLIGKDGMSLSMARGKAMLMLTEGADVQCDECELCDLVESHRQALNKDTPNWQSRIVAQRYEHVQSILNESVKSSTQIGWNFTDWLDSILLHKVYGWATLFTVMSVLFWSMFSLAEKPKSWIEDGFGSLGAYLADILPAGPINSLITDGVIWGVGSVLSFLPQIFILLFFIGVLEASGYLPRAAFLMDRVMNKVGLPGRAFIPLLSSFACAVPAILGARALGSKEERLATILVAPWMSCSARLPIYLMMIAAMVPPSMASAWTKAAIMLGAYTAGALGAFGMSWILRKTLLKGKASATMMELPPYRVPTWKNIFIDVYRRCMMFVKRAGTVILAFSIIVWFLMAYPQTNGTAPDIEASYMGQIGKVIEPAISPLGYDWQVGVGLLTSFAARELFVSTMAILSQAGNPTDDLHAFAENLGASGLTGMSPLACLSLMVFFIFAMQCVSTLAVVKRETGSLKWVLFQWTYMTGFAYLAAMAVYQTGKLLGWA